jgi:hypothetical protein
MLIYHARNMSSIQQCRDLVQQLGSAARIPKATLTNIPQDVIRLSNCAVAVEAHLTEYRYTLCIDPKASNYVAWLSQLAEHGTGVTAVYNRIRWQFVDVY